MNSSKVVTLQQAQRQSKSLLCNSLCFARNMCAEYPVHIHDCYELELLLTGEAVHWMNGNRHEIRPGSILLVTPDDFHSYSTTKPLCFFTIKIGKEDCTPGVAAFLKKQKKALLAQLGGAEYETIKNAFLQLETEFKEKHVFYEERIDALLVLILTTLYRHRLSGLQEALTPVAHQTIHNALAYIHQHMNEEISLTQVAGHCGLTPCYFSSFFRKAVGCGFKEYLLNQKMELACQRLVVTNDSIIDVAFQAGFGSVSTFQRVFKQKKGVSSSQYRHLIRGQIGNETIL